MSLTASAGMTLWGLTYFALQYLLAAGRVVSAPAFAAKDADHARGLSAPTSVAAADRACLCPVTRLTFAAVTAARDRVS
ncbi:hypothetical protein [Streptomyces katrae]|uniref:Uncharacterized protein n=1 Tax=Streptomyces katrae TaxID=68223 RepID=A0A0F4IJR1_9ACTN|nr:hypothetical protein [Streptomyces katrae]KJY22265.1 hypothetical protein VR44_37990 [Streptomyces katrae]